MATEYQFPSSVELQLIAQDKLPRLTAQRPVFTEFPMVDADAPLLLWEQVDNYTGLQQIRGLNGVPAKVAKTGAKRYMEEPGVYGEFEPIDERELTMRRMWGSLNAPINITDLVMLAQDKLLGRRLDRIEKIIWDLLCAGTFSVAGPSGATLANAAYTFQTYDASTWSTASSATPLYDFRQVKLKQRGHSVSFGAGAKAYCNQVTANYLTANTNAADLYGRRTSGLATANNIAAINGLLLGENLPQIVEYDEGYLDDSAVFQPFIPDNKVVVVGQRPAGQRIGEYRQTRNVNNPGMAPGPYMRVIDRGEEQIPRSVEVHDGHNGGPVMFYPSAVVVMDVS